MTGTDCQDCGPIGAGNFTRSVDHDWWDDDDVGDFTEASSL